MYAPNDEEMCLVFISNLLNHSYSHNILEYIHRIIEFYIDEKKFFLLKYISDEYLINKLVSSLISEIYFQKTYEILTLLLCGNFFLNKFLII